MPPPSSTTWDRERGRDLATRNGDSVRFDPGDPTKDDPMAYRIDKTLNISDPFGLLGGEGVIEEHLRVTIPASGDERTYFLQIAETAIRHTADITGRNPVAATYRVHVPGIPVRLELPFRASSITAAGYLTTGSSTYTDLGVSNFGIYGDTAPTILFSRDSISEPSDRDDDHPYPFRFTITGLADTEQTTDGETPTSQVPRAFVHAALLYMSHLYENRQAVAFGGKPYEIPLAFDRLVKSILRIR